MSKSNEYPSKYGIDDTVNIYDLFKRNNTDILEVYIHYITSKVDIECKEYCDIINSYKQLQEWYMDCPDEVEMNDIKGRDRLKYMKGLIPREYLNIYNGKKHDLYIRERSDTHCPRCTVPVVKLTDEDNVMCKICYLTYEWKSGKLIDYGTFETIGYYTSSSSSDEDISKISIQICNNLSNISTDSVTREKITNVINYDSIIDRIMMKMTMRYSTDELIEKYMINRIIDNEYTCNYIYAGLLRDMGINKARYKLLSHILMSMNNASDLTHAIDEYERFFNTWKSNRYIGIFNTRKSNRYISISNGM